MNCSWLDQFENEQIGEIEFQKHAQMCKDCQKYLKQMNDLLSIAKSLKKEIHVPHLWHRIETALEKEGRKSTRKLSGQFWIRSYPVLRFAAVIVLLFAAGMFLWKQFGTPRENILADSALKRVEKQEAAYIRAIEELETRTESKMEVMDLELAFLYRDRLETIDAQIERCREALEENPGNAHIRRYMLAALQEKKETLKEILSSSA